MSLKSFEASSTVSSTVSSRHQPSRGSRSSGSSLLEAPEALGAAMRGPRGSGSGYLEAPEALGAAISRLQRLSRPKWLRPQISRVFSSILEPGDLSGNSPDGSGRLEEAFRRLRAGSRGLPGGFEWPRERSEAALKRVKWLRVTSRALEEARNPPEPTAN